MRPRFFWVLVICISVRKNYRNPKICWYRSWQNRKPSSFLTLIFPIFGEHEKGAKYRLKVLEYIAKILKVLKGCTETAHAFCVA